MKGKENVLFLIMTVLAGTVIGLGGTASLLSNALLGGLFGKVVGSVFFATGMFAVITFDMKLFTGMIARIPTMEKKKVWQLPVCFLGNAVGMAIVWVLVKFSFIGEVVEEQAAALIFGKLNAELWAVKCFCSAILCGMLITLSVRSFDRAPKKNLSATVGVILPVAVFVFCGFDHSVANMLYLYFLGECSWRVAAYILLAVAGNLVGGVALPLVFRLEKQ